MGGVGIGGEGTAAAAGTTPAAAPHGGAGLPQGGATSEAGGAGLHTGGAGGAPIGTDPEIPSGFVPALIGVGYGGIRIVSKDGGSTWGDRASFAADGGDDENLLRAIVYGKGKWLATGWKLVTSDDGKSWTDHGMINEEDFLPCNIVEGLAYAGGWFYAACPNNPSRTFRSADGLEWNEHGTIGNTQGHLFLSFRGNSFVAYGDNELSFQSDDAVTFIQLQNVSSATYCDNAWKSEEACFNAAWFDGTYLRADWKGKISRSLNGSSWTMVYEDDEQNTLYRPRAIAAGYVAP